MLDLSTLGLFNICIDLCLWLKIIAFGMPLAVSCEIHEVRFMKKMQHEWKIQNR